MSEQQNQNSAAGGQSELSGLVRLHYRTPLQSGRGDLVPKIGAESWVKRQKEVHPDWEFWYEEEAI